MCYVVGDILWTFSSNHVIFIILDVPTWRTYKINCTCVGDAYGYFVNINSSHYTTINLFPMARPVECTWVIMHVCKQVNLHYMIDFVFACVYVSIVKLNYRLCVLCSYYFARYLSMLEYIQGDLCAWTKYSLFKNSQPTPVEPITNTSLSDQCFFNLSAASVSKKTCICSIYLSPQNTVDHCNLFLQYPSALPELVASI